MADYRRFEAWQAAHELAIAVYSVTSTWPVAERYGLVSQIRRAAFSAPVNIVEGSLRRGPREFRRFLDISLGSLAEVEYTLEFAEAVAVARSSDRQQLAPLLTRAGQLCFGLARSLARSQRAP